MADGIFDFFGPEAGQARRRRLSELGADAMYYIPPELRGLIEMLGEANPVSGVGRAGQAAQELVAPGVAPLDRVGAGGRMLSEMAGVVAPAMVASRAAMPAAQAIQEGLMGFSAGAQDVGRAVVDRLNQPGPMPTVYSNPIMRDRPGITAYHGSPHDFDRFSMEKIGTGEGAQAYGHGLYFAENEGVARGYRDALSRPYYALDDGSKAAEKYGADVIDIFERSGGDPKDMRDTIARIRSIVQRNLDDFGVSDASQLQPQFYGDLSSTTIEFANRADNLEKLINSGDVRLVDPGSMYEVRINANPEDFLDWDKPLSEQPQKVREAVNDISPVKVFHSRLNDEYRAYLEGQGGILASYSDKNRDEAVRRAMDSLTGENIVRSDVPSVIASKLREAGIPGIKYLDAGSRYTLENLPDNIITSEARQFLDQAGGDPEKALSLFNQSNPIDRWASSERDEVAKVIKSAKKTATRNYVVIDDRLIDIVRKYGIAAAAAMLGVSQADLAQAMEQQPQPQGLLE